MRIVKYTNCFKRDYRREKSGQRGGRPLDKTLMEVVDCWLRISPCHAATSIIR
jgi:hypothetical protein